MGNTNASGSSARDAVIAMKIDQPDGDGFQYQVLAPNPDFPGTHAQGKLHLLGLTGIDGSDEVDIFLTNVKPSIDIETGEWLDNTRSGPNATIEHFQISTAPGTTEMQHIKTFMHPLIATPNNMALLDRNSFYLTNDHGSAQVGAAAQLSPILGTGDVTYCTFDPATQTAPACHRVVTGLRFPNGLVRDHDGLVYVPSSFTGGVLVYSIDAAHNHELTPIGAVDLPYAIDNLAVDAAGHVWAPVFPKLLENLAAFGDPLGAKRPAAAAFRIVKHPSGTQWTAEKVIEDQAGSLLGGSTAVIHDAATGRLFFSGVASPFVSVCEPK